MNFRQSTCKTFDLIKRGGKYSARKLVELTGSTKSSVSKQIHNIKNRSHLIGADFFESEASQEWIKNMVLACIYVFCLKSYAEAERIKEFLLRIGMQSHVGISEDAIRGVADDLCDKIIKYYKVQKIIMETLDGSISIIAGADETFFEN